MPKKKYYILLLVLFNITNNLLSQNFNVSIKHLDSKRPIALDIDDYYFSINMENALLNNNFNIISYEKALEISKDSANMPVYVLTINGNRRTGIVRCDGKIIRSINGRIINISNNDELIGTFSFYQELWDAMCTDFVMNNIASRLKKESNN